MSGLELVAGIAGVAAAAIKVSVAMNDLAEELGSAGRDVRYIGNDMAGFAQVLRLVQTSLEEGIKTAGSTVIQSVFDTLPQLVEQCTMVYDEASSLMVALKGSTSKDSSISFFQRMKFVFYKGRITILRSLLDSSKSTLNLLLVTLNIEMAKSKVPDKSLMDQLQNERKAFIRVVYSQNKALDEAMKEVDKAKKEASRFKSKRDKEKYKDKEKEEPDEYEDLFPKRNSTPYAYQPPPAYALHSAPSVSQLVYQPPSLERFNSVRKSSNAVTNLALSLEPVNITTENDRQTPPTSPPDPSPSTTHTAFQPTTPHTSPPAQQNNKEYPDPKPSTPNMNNSNQAPQNTTRPPQPSKRIFSDPGPGHPTPNPTDHLRPNIGTRERSRSPYGFSKVPQDNIPKVPRARATSQPSNPPGTPTKCPDAHIPTPASNTARNGEKTNTETIYEAPEYESSTPYTQTTKKSYSPPPPPTHPPPHKTQTTYSPTAPRASPSPSPPPLLPPRHNAIYIVHQRHQSQEPEHLSLRPFDTVVDVVAHIPSLHVSGGELWEGSLGDRRGPRGVFPRHVVCLAGDERIGERLGVIENWFAGEGVGFIGDVGGRCWVRPGWGVGGGEEERVG